MRHLERFPEKAHEVYTACSAHSCMDWVARDSLQSAAVSSRRSAPYDPLEITSRSMWYVVRSMHRSVLEARPLAAGQNLKRVFAQAIIHWIDEGWTVGEFSSRIGTFFCRRGNDTP